MTLKTVFAALGVALCGFKVSAEVMLDINDDATALVVNVPPGELTGCKLELAYDNSTGAASKFVPDNRSPNRGDWANVAMLDLSEKTDTWPTASSAAGCSLSFAPNATVTVDTGTKPLRTMRVVSWDARNPPAGVDTLKVLGTNPRGLLMVRKDGIYARCGLVILYR